MMWRLHAADSALRDSNARIHHVNFTNFIEMRTVFKMGFH
jgi:hypothetical protein